MALIVDPARGSTMFPEALMKQAEAVLLRCRAAKHRLVTAESCTGGLIATALTAMAGSSDVFDGAFVTYSNAAKTAQLGVPAELIASDGAVSASVAVAMAEGALARSGADGALSVTGIAGPGGGTPQKPVGTVILARAGFGRPTAVRLHRFAGDRNLIRLQSAMTALQLALDPND